MYILVHIGEPYLKYMSKPASEQSIQLITKELFSELEKKALQSQRGRVNHNFHVDLNENPNRFLNVMSKGTYFTPHRHIDPPKPEGFIILQGKVAMLIFDDQGTPQEVHLLDAQGETRGIDIPPGIWHSLLVLSETAICYEVKPGPYVAASDKDFASWAPKEGSADCSTYQETLKKWVETRIG